MLFTSVHWVVFLIAVFAVYHLAPSKMRRWIMLLASVYFYASWSAPFLALIGFQLCVDWTCGSLLATHEDSRHRRLILATSVIVNLSALLLFKYQGLIAHTLTALGLNVPDLKLTLPLAISFYTFESMSYTIDVYRRRLEPVKSPLHLALFITWFPHLVAGPIIRPSEMVPQLAVTKPVDRERFFSGFTLMLIGYSKKLLIADWLARVVEPAFKQPGDYTGLELLLVVYAYAFQIYCDFSAYTDIARGASRWFGIELPENFADPYLATSITDFWRRWHMTLSHWLRDYLYIPLGGNRRGSARTYVNLFLTMLLGGLWHGANWTFVVWGGLHGLYLAVERALRIGDKPPLGGWRRSIRIFVTFHLVCFAWIFFRADSFGTAWTLLGGIANGGWHFTATNLLPILGAGSLIALYWVAWPLRNVALDLIPSERAAGQLTYAVVVGGLVAVLMVFGATTSAFIYFQF